MSRKKVPAVAYLGPPGTYSEEAAVKYLKGNKAIIIPCTDMEEVFIGIANAEWDEGILPVENSTEGAIGQTMDLLMEYPTITISGEVVLPVKHSLLVPEGVTLDQIELVISHPQAIGQCRRFLKDRLPWAVTRESTSTAHAAREVAAAKQPWAALASPIAADTYRLKILEEKVNDYDENITRFLVLGKKAVKGSSNEYKTTIIITTCDRPGSLHSVLVEFAAMGINLTRIESRPSKKKLGEYVFFIDFIGNIDNIDIAHTLKRVQKKCITCRVVGSYPVATRNIYNCASKERSLEDIRSNIDVIDSEIIRLLGQRMAFSKEVAQHKNLDTIKDSVREKEIFKKIFKGAIDNNLDPLYLSKLYEIILDYSIKSQRVIISKRFAASCCLKKQVCDH